MNPGDDIAIKINTRKVIPVLLLSLVFVLIGVLLIFYSPAILAKAIGLAGVLFFGVSGVFCLKKLLHQSAGLLISKSGITDSSKALSIGFVPWAEITTIEEKLSLDQKVVSISVQELDNTLSRVGIFGKMIARENLESSGAPINISAASLAISHDELLKLLVDYQRNL